MVLFQFYGGYRGGYGGGVFSDFIYWLDFWGVRDIILPFILIFTIFFAVMQRVKIFGEKSKRYNVALSMVIALLVVIPHATGTYPMQYDVVNIINDSIPEVALLVVVVVLLLIMVGLIGGDVPKRTGFTSLLAAVSAIVLLLIFVSTMTPLPIFQYIDPSIQALIVILLVFGLIVWYVTKPETTEPKGMARWFWKEMMGEEKPPERGGG